MYAELHLHTEYSFLDGASTLEDMVRRASQLGIVRLAMTDHDNVSGAVKFANICNKYSIIPILGAEVTMEDGSHLTLLAQNRIGHSNLCGLLTLSRLHGDRINPRLPWSALEQRVDGLICLSGCRKGVIPSLMLANREDMAAEMAVKLRDWFSPENFYLELQDDFTPRSRQICYRLVQLGNDHGINVVATNNVHYADRESFLIHDILRCVHAGITINDVHIDRPMNDERHLKGWEEMSRIFAWNPDAVSNSARIAERCEWPLPSHIEMVPKDDYVDAVAKLRTLTFEGGRRRYRYFDSKTYDRISGELDMIAKLGFADLFLMVHKIVHWTREQGIRCTGRGSAADSCVAYCLHLTDIDVIKRNLPFERFLTEGKLPDIDMDFPSDRRDEVFQYIVDTYGAKNVGRVCTFNTYWGRGAVRDVGKVLSMPHDILSFCSKSMSGFIGADGLEEAFNTFAELKPHTHLKPRLRALFNICGQIAGFPRHIASHSSGVVISRMPLETIAPLMPAAGGILPIWTLDKDDAEILGAIKFDVLALRTLSAIADAECEIKEADPGFVYEQIPDEDKATFEMMRSGKAIGAFQFESAAQLALAVTLLPKTFEHLVASVALIRPGPIRGNVVSRFVDATRTGWVRMDAVYAKLYPLLAKTHGCIVYQEQANNVVRFMMGCEPWEADRFRKDLTKHVQKGTLQDARNEFVEKARREHPDLSPRRLHMLFDEIEGWAGYGFIEGHAASFALTGYRTAYLSEHHPAEYYAGMMNHQPMGFYSANTLAAEARRRGARILPLDINSSDDKCVIEDPGAIRLGLRLVAGMTAVDIGNILAARANGNFESLFDFCARVPMHQDRVENLILGGAFDTLHSHRRGLLFGLEQTLGAAAAYRQSSGSAQVRMQLGRNDTMSTSVVTSIEDFSEWERFLWTWRIVGVTAECHVFSHLRERLIAHGYMTTYEALQQPDGTRVRLAGLNIRPHRPPTRSGHPVLFASLEDETELIGLSCFGEAIDRCTATFLVSAAILVDGIVQRKGEGAGVLVQNAKPMSLQDIVVRTEIGRGQSRPVAHPVSAKDILSLR